MAWVEVERKRTKLPVGGVSVTKAGRGRLDIGAATVRTWNLGKFDSVDIFQDDKHPHLLAFRMMKGGEGRFKVSRRDDKTAVISCRAILKKAGAKCGRYRLSRDLSVQNFFTLDTSVMLND